MSEQIVSRLRFLNYYVDSIEFSNNRNFNDRSVDLEFDIDKKIEYPDDSTILTTLKIDIFKDALEKDYPFSFSVVITGVFELEGYDEEKKNIAEINSVSILFPYARAIISSFTANSNVQPLILPPINVIKLFERNDESK